MITWPDIPVHLHKPAIDFRKSINGLVSLVSESLDLSPFDKALYVFSNRQRNRIKILYWDNNGFCLWYKRLEEEKFKWPKPNESQMITLTPEQFAWLLRGLDISKLTPHRVKTYAYVC